MKKLKNHKKIDLEEDCSLVGYSKSLNIDAFDCGDPDLNDFFHNDAFQYQDGLIGKTHAFILDGTRDIVCAFTVSNDALRIDDKPRQARKSLRESIPESKVRWPAYPAVKIGRIGVDKSFSGNGIGSQAMDFVKGWFCDQGNKTGCRFITVDAYNNPKALGFYEKNDFSFLFGSETDELNYLNADRRTKYDEVKTRFMYFDLMRIM